MKKKRLTDHDKSVLLSEVIIGCHPYASYSDFQRHYNLIAKKARGRYFTQPKRSTIAVAMGNSFVTRLITAFSPDGKKLHVNLFYVETDKYINYYNTWNRKRKIIKKSDTANKKVAAALHMWVSRHIARRWAKGDTLSEFHRLYTTSKLNPAWHIAEKTCYYINVLEGNLEICMFINDAQLHQAVMMKAQQMVNPTSVSTK